MEDLLRPIYQERASSPNTLGILIIEKNKPISPVTDNFDVILLVVVRDLAEDWFVKHYEFENKTAAMHVVDEKLLYYWIDTSTYRRAVEWIINGQIVFDRNEYISNLKEQLDIFPQEKRKLKMAMEFAKLTRSYMEAKDLFQTEQYLDSYSRVIRSLHYLARLAIIERGYHPEVIVWNHVKRIDPEVYKLYEELTKSNEGIDKRVELMLLAVDFAISTRARTCAEHLLELMNRKEEAWTFGELKLEPEIEAYSLDLSSLVEYLTEKNIIEAIRVDTKGNKIYHRQYKAKLV
ncbi:nucleotidyltransferase-like protein [Sediminibacillus massiliensis]|uniref:nucleotidyltransferase-like protein n=1 Tax=Sediminibacillus massiliensis TaxID=1926277 RepID=UPI000988800B|nr:nucleotidyltransferase-like protein [Sediminibacillus massiliensis]